MTQAPQVCAGSHRASVAPEMPLAGLAFAARLGYLAETDPAVPAVLAKCIERPPL
jgi:hypothetical protein